MSEDPNYHDQPTTLDPAVEVKDDAPLAQGHTEEKAAQTREAIEEHKQAVEDTPEEEVTARKPGDHAGSDQTEDETEDEAGETTGSDDDCAPSGTIEEVKAWVGEDSERAQKALDAERSGQNRPTLIAYLEGV
jgi:hypothetical protein